MMEIQPPPASADVWSQMDACDKNNIFPFNADGTDTTVDAGIKFSTSTIKHQISLDNKEIEFSITTNSYTYTQTLI